MWDLYLAEILSSRAEMIRRARDLSTRSCVLGARNVPESIDHFLLQCPRFHSHRQLLRGQLIALNVTTFDLPTLLAAAAVHPSRRPAVIRLTSLKLSALVLSDACQQIGGMETSKVNQLLEGQTSFALEEDGVKIYNVLSREEIEDRETGFRVFRIGQPSDRPTRCVLLLGETGGGKTTLINATINHLFGVRFEDPFRLRVKEETEDDRMETDSQTDRITAYFIHYKAGMQHEYNFVLIDTPGLADTRGSQHQHDTRRRLEEFLVSEFGIDDLHCVGLVAKANTNRDYIFQKALLGEITSLLGDAVPEITHVFATFAVDMPIVDTVMKNAGVSFKNVFQFDNGVLFCPQMSDTIVPLRWKVMSDQYETFINALTNAPSVSIAIIREKKLFETCKKNLETQIEKLATSITAIEIDKKICIKYELQEARNEGWMRKETVVKYISVTLEDGIHAHNCYSCKKTCVFPCYNNSGMLAGLAGGAGGTAAGAVVANLTTMVMAGAASNAASRGLAASVGSMAVRTLGGAITAAEVGAVGAAGMTASLAIGGALGIAVGLFTKAMFGKMTNSCGIVGNQSTCGRDGCTHSLPQHIKEEKMFVKESKVKNKIDEDMKKLYDVATSKKLEANAKIINGQQKIFSYRRSISHCSVELLSHAKKIQDLTSQDSDYIEDVTCQLISQIRLGEPNIIPYAIKHVTTLNEALRRLVPYTSEEVLGKHEIVEELLTKIYKDN
ncbi:hypothetical protein GWK47_041429 [Chionoecetes opilio]|uniref:G domain-containing protein n=1 Tax=Chionoecetes opilio TaxID=41210 RepID=A0A8J5CWV8_CHIOP|nr:hypothetical protein GWK47_041429 [Chionoecetes opilio]